MCLDLRARIALVLSARIDRHTGTGRRTRCTADGRSVSRHPAWDSPRYATSKDDSPRARGFLDTPIFWR